MWEDEMHSLPKDVLIYLLQYLDAWSIMRVRQCSTRYALHGQSDLIWHRLTMKEFGAVEKTDVLPVATSWFSRRPEDYSQEEWRLRSTTI